MYDGAGERPRDSLDELDLGDDQLSKVVQGIRLDLDDHIVGPGYVVGRGDPLDIFYVLCHLCGSSDFGLDQHERSCQEVTSDPLRSDENRPVTERGTAASILWIHRIVASSSFSPQRGRFDSQAMSLAERIGPMGLHIARTAALPFANRTEAGRALGRYIQQMLGELDVASSEIAVLGLPRGGVVVAAEVARILGTRLDVLPTRKLGAPGNPELAIGAVSVAGDPYLSPSARRLASGEWIERETRIQRDRMSAQLRDYRAGDDFSHLSDTVALAVDDGTATGATAVAASNALRRLGARAVWVAVPVAPPEALELVASLADEVFSLASRADFQAVGMWYVDFGQTSDDEVRQILSEFGGDGGPRR